MMTEQEIIYQIKQIECALEPERLYWDGERDRHDAKREERNLLAKRKKLVTMLKTIRAAK